MQIKRQPVKYKLPVTQDNANFNISFHYSPFTIHHYIISTNSISKTNASPAKK